MSQLVEELKLRASKLTNEPGVTNKVPTGWIKIKTASLAKVTFWPGKLGAETTLNPNKYPKLQMFMLPNGSLRLIWADGSQYTVGIGNIEGMEHE